jgi:cytochrome c peroxidase
MTTTTSQISTILPREPARKGRPAQVARGVAAAFWMTIGIAVAAAPAHAQHAEPDLAAMKAKYQRPAEVPFPDDNAYSPAKAELGQKLFFDPRLSGPSTMSCASCHNPGLSWSDGLPTAIGSGANHLTRRSPSILNLAWAEALFWDGRADSLEKQALGPIQAPGEMNNSMPMLVSMISDLPGYREAFATAFADEPISAKTIAKAIATFERTVVSGQSPFDRWIAGEDTAIEDAAKRGFVTFNTKAHCAACHGGWRFTNDSFHDIGLPDADLGRGALMPAIAQLSHAFKTPGLRNIAERAPYMHDGSVKTLTAVVHHYDGGFLQRPSLSDEIHKLDLTEHEVTDLVAFLKTLSSKDATIAVPSLPTMEIN